MSVPDEEIIHLCKTYSTPIDGIVHREMVRLQNPIRRTVTGSTRYVDVNLNSQTCFRNFYWLEGPLHGDVGRRVTVLHNGQPQQCSHCLKLQANGCPGGGNGKLCHSLGTERAKMSVYMESLRLQDKYIPLKTRYNEQQARAFPVLGKKVEVGDNQNINNMDVNDVEAEIEGEVLPVSPVEERDAQIENLKKELEILQKEVQENNNLKETVTKIKAENNIAKKTTWQLTRKLNLTRKTSEMKLAEMISSGSLDDSPHLITSYAACLFEDDFDFDIENYVIVPKNESFLKNIEDGCNLEDEKQKERCSRVRHQVLDRVKKLITSSPSRGGRRQSIGSLCSQKRELEESEDDLVPPTKPRTISPEK